jgi:hypothetical protein
MPMKNPVHPGQIVRHDCLEPLGPRGSTSGLNEVNSRFRGNDHRSVNPGQRPVLSLPWA